MAQEPKKEWKRYPKHLAGRGPPWEDIVDGTKSGHAKYARNENVRQLETRTIDEGRMFFDGGVSSYYYHEFDRVIGASEGVETRIVRVQWDSGSDGTYHGRPYTEQQLISELRELNPEELERFQKRSDAT